MELQGIEQGPQLRSFTQEAYIQLGLWNWTRDYIQDNWPENISYHRLREAVKAAWDQIPASDLDALIEDMGNRCQAVIDANGLFPRY
jgi:hypothetical protein